MFKEPLTLGESQVEFVGDKAEYLHPETAVETIRPIAEYLLEHESGKLYDVAHDILEFLVKYGLRKEL